MKQEFFDAFGLDGKNILITGGRSGLGFAMAKAIAAAGGFPIIASTASLDVQQKAVDEIGAGCCYQYDVADTQQAADLIARIIQEHGHLDGLINNAGVHCKKPFEQTTIEDYQRIISVHLLGSVALTQAAIPHMKKQGSGSIIFISSMSAMLGMTNVSAYSAAKTAVQGLTRSLTGELAQYGIRVNAITPGFIDTPMFHQAVDNDIPRQQKILGHTPMQRYGQPMDIGWAAVYLCSNASSFVTGVCLPVDGGCSIGF